MKRLKQGFANLFIGFLKNPFVRYRFLMPLMEALNKNHDEEILSKAFQFIQYNHIVGDYLEFGVWKGRSFVKAYHFKKYLKLKKPMRFYAFDSFQGLPEVKDSDQLSSGFKKGDYTCDEETFRKILTKNGVDMNEVVIVPGWYTEVLNDTTKENISIKEAAIIFVDCDLYESAVPVLDFITDLVTDGTIIIFDDWFCFKGDPNKGEQKAFKEWLARNPHITATQWQKVNWKTNSFILHKNV